MAGKVQIVINARDEASKEIDKLTGKLSGIGSKIGPAIKGIGIGLAAAGTAAIGFGAASVKSFADTGDAVQKMAQRTGFATEALSELNYIAELSGATSQDLENAIRRISRVSDMAGQGVENNYTRRLEQLGLSVEEFIALPQEEKFNSILNELAGVDDAAQRTAIAFDLFGDAGTRLLPMVESGSEAIEGMRQEAHELGLVFDQEAADSAANFNDALTKVQGAMQGVMNEIAQALMPALEPLADAFLDLIKSLPLKEISQLIKDLLPPLVELFVEILDAIPLETVIKFVKLALTPLLNVVKNLLPVLEPLFNILEKILIVLTPVIEFIGDLIGKISDLAGGALGGVLNTISGIFGNSKSNNNNQLSGKEMAEHENRFNALKKQYDAGLLSEKQWSKVIAAYTPVLGNVGNALGFANGGVVPGPIGQPVPVIAHGGEVFAGVGKTFAGPTVNVYVQGSIQTERDLAESIRETLLRTKTSNSSLGLA